jgi:hypothetical protein
MEFYPTQNPIETLKKARMEVQQTMGLTGL